MSERSKPFVGVSGVVNLKRREPSGLVVTEPQELFLQAAATRSGLHDTGRLLALGVKATDQTQWQDEPLVINDVEFGPEWFPVGNDEFRDALSYKRKHPQTLGVMEISFDRQRVHASDYRLVYLARTAYRARMWLEAIQFDDLPFHEDERLLQSLEQAKGPLDSQTILRVREETMEALGPKKTAKALSRYAGALDYVLFDNTKKVRKFLRKAYASEPLSEVGFGIAGDFEASDVRDSIAPLSQEFVGLSWSSDGLHPLNNVGTRPLQMDQVKEFMQTSTDVIAN